MPMCNSSEEIYAAQNSNTINALSIRMIHIPLSDLIRNFAELLGPISTCVVMLFYSLCPPNYFHTNERRCEGDGCCGWQSSLLLVVVDSFITFIMYQLLATSLLLSGIP